MANPKYADLPGIAFDQPDVYETSDLPESDQSHSIAEAVIEQSDCVEPILVSASDAFEHFKGKSLDTRDIDFTDEISNKKKTGYRVREWEMLDNAAKASETPSQAYNRLQYEIKELLEEVHQMKESSDKSKDEVPSVMLMEQIENLQKQLQDLHMEEILGSEAIQEMSDPLHSVHNKLLQQIENFKKEPSSEKKKPKPTAASAKSGTDNNLTYELYMRPEQSRLEESAKISELEQRLKNLEAVVGTDKSKLSFLTANTDEKSILAAVKCLSSKLNLLDSVNLDQIENRLVALHQCMQLVAEKKQQIDDAEKLNKVAELYELAKKVEGMSTSLPQVVDRLVALKDLHEQALQFSKALTQLDTTQQQITSSLDKNERLLKTVQEAFVQNNGLIEKNVSSLSARIDALKK